MKLFKKNSPTLLFWALLPSLIGIFILCVFLIFIGKEHSIGSNINYVATQTVGTFIGGVVPVFLSFTTIILIYLTYKTNRKELKKLNKFNNKQNFEITFNGYYNTLEKLIENDIKSYDDAYKFTIQKIKKDINRLARFKNLS